MLVLTDDQARTFAARALAQPVTELEPMPGGASTRSYMRARAGDRSVVLMFVPDAKPDEVTGGVAPTRWPFLEVRELLEKRAVRVPRVVLEDCDAGLIALEDLGDRTLAAYLDAEPQRRADIYRVAVRDLARAQKSLRELPEGCIVSGRAFDETLLRWELDHFREWGLDARGKALGAGDRTEFDALAGRLAKRIAGLRQTFVHRDYQSRNLMVEGEVSDPRLVWIDFQDALLGPRVYDLVALLGDSYQSFTRAFIDERLDDFASELGYAAEERAAIGREFDLVTVQRKLKDAGRFVFIDRVKKNPSFLQYVEPTIEKVRAALERLADDTDMRALSKLLERVL